jgi:hypothetical protein
VQDVNDPPVYVFTNTTIPLEENWAVGRPFFTVSTFDEDTALHNDLSTFKLVGGNVSLFDIDLITGQLVAAVSFNFEDPSHGPLSVGRCWEPGAPARMRSLQRLGERPSPPL